MEGSELRGAIGKKGGGEPFRVWHAAVMTVAMAGCLMPVVLGGIGGVVLDGVTGSESGCRERRRGQTEACFRGADGR